MKKIVIGLIAIGLTTQVFALSAIESTVLQGRWEVAQQNVHTNLETTVGTYSSIVNGEIWKENVQSVCSSDIKRLTIKVVRSTGEYDRFFTQYSNTETDKALNIRGWQEEFIPMCKNYLLNYVGQEVSFNFRDASSLGSNFTTTQYCTNYSSYLRHIQKNEDLSLAFGTFTSRLPAEKLDIITKISDSKTEIQAHALITYLSKSKRVKSNSKDKIVFSTMPFIDFYFNRNNKSSKNGIGGNDLELKMFLNAVMSKNFYKADKILKKHMKQSRKIVKKAQYICDETSIYK